MSSWEQETASWLASPHMLTEGDVIAPMFVQSWGGPEFVVTAPGTYRAGSSGPLTVAALDEDGMPVELEFRPTQPVRCRVRP